MKKSNTAFLMFPKVKLVMIFTCQLKYKLKSTKLVCMTKDYHHISSIESNISSKLGSFIETLKTVRKQYSLWTVIL